MSSAVISARKERLTELEAVIEAAGASIVDAWDEVKRDRLFMFAGCASVEEWAEKRFGPRWGRLLPAEQRQELVSEKRAAGQTIRAIAEDVGVGFGTVHRDLAVNPSGLTAPDEVVGKDGKSYPPSKRKWSRAQGRPDLLVANIVAKFSVLADSIDGIEIGEYRASEDELRGLDQIITVLNRLRRSLRG